MNEAIAAENTWLINQLNETVERLQQAFLDINAEIDGVANTLETSFQELKHRTKFHYDRGLKGEEYIIEHGFIRGWDVFQERAFHYVSLDFIGLPDTLKRTLENAIQMVDIEDINTRKVIYLPVLDAFLSRLELINRAEEFMNKTDEAYRTGKYLQNYRLTPKRRYDLTYIHLPLLQIKAGIQEEHYLDFLKSLNMMRHGLAILMEVGEVFVESGLFNASHFESGKDEFLAGGRKFNYRVFQFESKIVHAPLKEMQKRIADFEVTRRSLDENMQRTQTQMEGVKSLLRSMLDGAWVDIVNITNVSSRYLHDFNMSKTELSISVTSLDVEDSVRAASTFFNDIRLKTSTMQTGLMDLKVDYVNIWTKMLAEDSVKQLYAKIYEDCQDFLNDSERYDFFIEIFAPMLRRSESSTRQLMPKDIVTRMNGDFHVLQLAAVIDGLNEEFQRMQTFLDVGKHIGDSDELFLDSFRNYKAKMKSFLDSNNIDSTFYRQVGF